MKSGSNCVRYNLLHLRKDVSVKINWLISELCLNIFGKIFIAQLIGRFIFAIFFTILLNSVVDQMNEFVMQLVSIEIEFFWSCPNVSFFVKVTFYLTIYTRYKSKASNIKLPFLVKQGIGYILLNYYSWVIDARILNDLANFIIIVLYFDSLTSIWVFTRF